MHKNRLAALGLTVGLVGGGAAGLAFGIPGVSQAQTTSTSTDGSTTTTAPSANAPTTPAGTATAPSGKRGDWEAAALAPLVKAGTITQAQADAVVAALETAHPAGGPGSPGGDHGGRRGARGGFGFDAAAKALGITTTDLQTALQGGKTIAAVAKDKGVDLQKVIDAMVAEAKVHVDAEVAAGRHTQAEGDAELKDMTARISDIVNGKVPAAPAGMGRGHGPFGGNGQAPTASTTPTTTA